VIAGFLRNIYKYDIYTKFMEVQHVISQLILEIIVKLKKII
jgi:hypothetical protein